MNTATEVPESGTVPGLLTHHLDELKRSGLTIETIKAAKIFSETNYQRVEAFLNWKRVPKKMLPCIVYPFVGAEGENGYYRIKPDIPRSVSGRIVKYESPRGRTNEVYLPPGVSDVFKRPEVELLFTEGEKKSLAVTQAGFRCLGLVGVWGWKDGKNESLLPALERIVWSGRPVLIVFDSDIADKPEVQDAESRLAVHLQRRGANVRVVRLPAGAPGPDGKPTKMGLDDFLVAHGAVAFRNLLDEALDPVPMTAVEMRADASRIDAAKEAGKFLKQYEVDGFCKVKYWRGTFWLWVDGRYVELTKDDTRAELIRFLNKNYVHLTVSYTGNVVDQVKAQAALLSRTEPPKWLERPSGDWPTESLLSAKSSIIDLKRLTSGESDYELPATPKLFVTSALDYDFQIDAPPPTAWLNFLQMLWHDDDQSIAVLQEWIGYLLTADTSQQKILMLIGPKRSGKGTIARVIRGLIGPENVCGPTLGSLATRFGLWSLLGKSAAIINDARLSGRSDQAVVVERLLSISGEDAIEVDRKNLEPVTCKLPTRIIIVSNELPKLNDSSGALTGRMILLRLTESFYGREDHDLTERLLQERPAILLWAIAGWQRLHQRGRFVQPDSSLELLGELHDLVSPIALFIRERCVLGLEYRSTIEELFATWKGWCQEKGRDKPGTEQLFGRDLLAAVPRLRRVQLREGEQRHRAYDGIGLTR